MSPRNLTYYSLFFGFYLLIQIFFVRQLVLFNYAFCFVYIASILLLPFEVSKIALLFLGFMAGIIIDVFYNTLGMHAASMTLVAFLRPSIIKLLTPQRGYDERMILTLKSMGTAWFISYIGILTFIHHLLLFFLEASDFGLLLPTIIKVLASTIFTSLVILILQFFRKE